MATPFHHPTFQGHRTFWRDQLTRVGEQCRLSDPTRTNEPGEHGSLAVPLSDAALERLQRLSQGQPARAYVAFLAGFGLLVSRYSCRNKWSLWVPGMGEDESPLFLTFKVSPQASLRQFLGQLGKQLSNLHPYADFPLIDYLDHLGSENAELVNTGIFCKGLHTQTAKDRLAQHCQLWLDIDLEADHPQLTLHFDSGYLGEAYVTRMVRSFDHLLTQLNDVTNLLGDLDTLTGDEYQRIIHDFNRDDSSFSPDHSAVTLFERMVVEHPERIALVEGEREYSYRQLNEQANILAHRLRQEHGIAANQLVGFLTNRNAETITAILGVLKAGGVYMPIDPLYPANRIDYMVSQVGIELLIVQEEHLTKASKMAGPCLVLEHAWDVENPLTENPPLATQPHDLIYLMHTSGSTGKPKGVGVAHRGVVRLVHGATYHPFNSETVTLQIAPLAFDASTWEIWSPLLNGGKLVVFPHRVPTPAAIEKEIKAHGINCLFLTTALFNTVIEEEPETLADIRYLLTGGEAISNFHVGRAQEHLPNTQIMNLYGPTELTTYTTYHPVPRGEEVLKATIPIGGPVSKTTVHILDLAGEMRPVPIGVPGELYMGGAGLARGYWQQPALTATRFVPNPFSEKGGERLYRSGDVVHWNEAGDILFQGRVDYQVKVRGFRIELAEIENRLAAHESVTKAAVRVFGDTAAEKYIAAYAMPRKGVELEAAELNQYLSEHLPAYMIPARWVILDDFPMKPNGKLDLKALPEPETAAPLVATVQPATETETLLADLWAKVLHLDQVDVTTSFFALGGDSIRAIQMLSQLNKLGYTRAVQDVFKHASVRAFAKLLENGQQAEELHTGIEPFDMLTEEVRNSLPPTVVDAYPLSRLQAGMVYHAEFNGEVDAYHDIITYRIEASFNETALRESWQALVERHPVLRTSFDLDREDFPLQLIHPTAALSLELADWRADKPAAQDQRLNQWLADQERIPFDWANPPLLRVAAFQLDGSHFRLAISFHHAILDGWSVGNLFAEWSMAYRAAIAGTTIELPPAIHAFREFIALEQQALAQPESREFWLNKLQGYQPWTMPGLVQDRESEKKRGANLDILLDEDLVKALQKTAARASVSFKTILFSAHLLAHARLAENGDVTTGYAVNGRPDNGLGEEALGLFLNMLPFRWRAQPGNGLQLLAEIFWTESQLQTHRRYPMPQIAQDMGARTFFRTAFNYVHFHNMPGQDSQADMRFSEGHGLGHTNFDLMVNFAKEPEGMRLNLEHDPEVLGPVIQNIAAAFQSALDQLAHRPEEALNWDGIDLPRGVEPVPVHFEDSSEPEVDFSEEDHLEGPLEEMLADIWAKLLKVPKVGANHNFFDLGGHSIVAVQLISRIRRHFAKELPIRRLFERPTVRELARYLKGLDENEMPPLQALEPSAEPCLSFTQQRLWFMDRFDPDSAALNMTMALRLDGTLDRECLEKALHEVIQRHEILRTRISELEGKPKLQILDRLPQASALQLGPVFDQEPSDDEVRELVSQEANRSFNLAQDLPFRFRLIRLSEHAHVLTLCIHHIAGDGWSFGIIFSEMKSAYLRLLQGQEPNAEMPVIQFADYASWERNWLRGDVFQEQRLFWQETLAGVAALDLPTDKARPKVLSQAGDHHRFSVPEELTQALKELSQEQEVTLSMTLLTAFQTLLYRYSDQSQFCVGSAIAGRNHEEVEKLIGPFANTVVLRADILGDQTVAQQLARVRQTALNAYSHGAFPFERLIDLLSLERDTSRHALYQVMFNLQNTPTLPEDLSLGSLQVTAQEYDQDTSQVDLSLDAYDNGSTLEMAFEFATDLYEHKTIARMAGHLLNLLAAFTSNPQAKLGQLDYLSTEERRLLLTDWGSREKPVTAEWLFLELWRDAVACNALHPAIVAGEQSLTYPELDQRANRLANHLISLGLKPGQFTAIWAEPSINSIVAMLATLKSGMAYVPLDPKYPQDRLAYMLAQAEATIVLIPGDSANQPDELPAPLTQAVSTLEIPTLFVGQAAMLPDDHAGELVEDPMVSFCGHNPAYMIFTSGSTGRPKGVVIPHRALASLLMASHESHGFHRQDRVLQFCSLSFDISVEEIFPTLISGATLVLRDEAVLTDFQALVNQIGQQQLTVINTPTAYWRNWVEHLATHQIPLPATLRTIIIGGEKIDPESIMRWRTIPGSDQVALFNGYGPTETSVTATLYRDEGELLGNIVPIGKAMRHVRLYLLDKQLELVPSGVPGEIFIGGPGLASGYQGLSRQTAQVFVPNPFAKSRGERLYRTGDWSKLDSHGDHLFLGRRDGQVKIRGFRIECAEIEKALISVDNIRKAIVTTQEVQGRKRLVAYIEAKGVDTAHLRNHLAATLPAYMVPSQFAICESFPLTANGKVDTAALTALEIEIPSAEMTLASPEERELAQIWAQVLGLSQVGPNENFFDLGGDSIVSIQLVAKAREFGWAFEVKDLFTHQTVRELVVFVRDSMETSAAANENQDDYSQPVPEANSTADLANSLGVDEMEDLLLELSEGN